MTLSSHPITLERIRFSHQSLTSAFLPSKRFSPHTEYPCVSIERARRSPHDDNFDSDLCCQTPGSRRSQPSRTPHARVEPCLTVPHGTRRCWAQGHRGGGHRDGGGGGGGGAPPPTADQRPPPAPLCGPCGDDCRGGADGERGQEAPRPATAPARIQQRGYCGRTTGPGAHYYYYYYYCTRGL
eukprot:1184353-Prorocentrum_minimum.AAC.2